MSRDHYKHLNICDDAPATWPTRLLLEVSLCSLLCTQFWGQIDCFKCANSTVHLHPSLCECTLCIQVFHIVWDWEHTLEDFRGFTFNFSAFTAMGFSAAPEIHIKQKFTALITFLCFTVFPGCLWETHSCLAVRLVQGAFAVPWISLPQKQRLQPIVLPQKAAWVCNRLHAWCDMFVSCANLQPLPSQLEQLWRAGCLLSGMLLFIPPPTPLRLFFFPKRVCAYRGWVGGGGAFKDVMAGWDGNISRNSHFVT